MDATVPVLMMFMTFASFTIVEASRGDTSGFFKNCVQRCQTFNCSNEFVLTEFYERQPIHYQILGWDCVEECKYDCMWKTSAVFKQKAGYIPQFYGKWPFARFLGIQEPASTLFSMLNGIAHVFGLSALLRQVKSEAPFRGWWIANGLIMILCWVFSTIFHTRDTPFTEKLDYAGGMIANVAALTAVTVRLVGIERLTRTGTMIMLGAGCSFVYRHLKFLFGVSFDYGYNMKVHLAIGGFHVIGWLCWAFLNRSTCPYAWKGAAVNFLMAATMALELLDFPPFLWTLDAHALWHLSTIPLIPLWYSFVIDDCSFLQKQKELEIETILKKFL
ncbi:unnamed protein product [Notodromas monacha]|uniref:Post-GPI attachment to proteins factor 3 n=1 Tax=Notodromas monacha TaxID=399045 RepID=A0A7R9C1U7_9CRUS|nr:unnamed protein product [Notodromas monacha]CAG0924772.1 unnamed protein product [Notodromas monacha]